MNGYGYGNTDDDQHRPLMYLRGYPIYAAYFVVMAIVLAFIASMLLYRFQPSVLDWLSFHSGAVLKGEVWRVITYGLVQMQADIWFLVELLLLATFGREVEKVFGRRNFFVLYGGLYLLTPLLFTVLGLWTQSATTGRTYGFAVFIAFATLLPGAVVFFSVAAKWIAIAMLAFYSITFFGTGNTQELLSLWVSCAWAYFYTRLQQGGVTLPEMNLFKRKPKLRVLPDLPKTRREESRGSASEPATASEIDALLDKIAQSGIGSLTPKERAKLDAASRKDGKRS